VLGRDPGAEAERQREVLVEHRWLPDPLGDPLLVGGERGRDELPRRPAARAVHDVPLDQAPFLRAGRDRLAGPVGDAVDAEDALGRQPGAVQVRQHLLHLGLAARRQAPDLDRDRVRGAIRRARRVALSQLLGGPLRAFARLDDLPRPTAPIRLLEHGLLVLQRARHAALLHDPGELVRMRPIERRAGGPLKHAQLAQRPLGGRALLRLHARGALDALLGARAILRRHLRERGVDLLLARRVASELDPTREARRLERLRDELEPLHVRNLRGARGCGNPRGATAPTAECGRRGGALAR
jgi:hypothetical protein